MKGNVKFYNEKKGFGFIVGEDAKEYFFHFSEISPEGTVLEENDSVEFEATQNERGTAAKCVVLA